MHHLDYLENGIASWLPCTFVNIGHKCNSAESNHTFLRETNVPIARRLVAISSILLF